MSFIVVGVSASSGSPQAITTAAREAVLHRVPLRAVQAWTAPRSTSGPGGRPPAANVDVAAAAKQAQATLRAQVGAALATVEQQPPGDVEIRLVRGTPGKVLLAESAEALMLVVDAPRSSVSTASPVLAHRLVYQASCPVLIMPPATR